MSAKSLNVYILHICAYIPTASTDTFIYKGICVPVYFVLYTYVCVFCFVSTRETDPQVARHVRANVATCLVAPELPSVPGL